MKSQIFNIWTGKTDVIAGPPAFVPEPPNLPSLSYHMPELHAELLSAVDLLLKLPSHELVASKSFPRILSRGVPLSSDAWGFAAFWPCIQEICETSEGLYEQLQLRRTEIREIRDSVRPSILPIPGLEALSQGGSLSMIQNGLSGSYILSDENNIPRFVIKPLDEDIGAIGNPKGYATPFTHSLLADMPLYRSCFREVAAFEIAEQVGVSSIIPRTAFAILEREEFHDLSEQISPKEQGRFGELLGKGDKEKLCSVQEYVQESKTLFEALQDLQQHGLTDEEIERLFDQTDFEEANILLWMTGDPDGHSHNFLVTPKRSDAIGHQMFGLRKIDNGFAFPEQRGDLYNSLATLPNARHSLSLKAIEKIQEIDPDELADTLIRHGLESSVDAMCRRIETLQRITLENPSMSIKKINKRLSNQHEKVA